KSWVLRSSKGGRQRLKTIGEYGERGLSLRDARRIALADGRTLSAMFNKGTVGELATTFYESQIAPRYKRPIQLKRYLDRDLRPIAGRKVVDITRADLSALVLHRARRAPVAANRLVEVIRRLFKFAVQAGVIEHDPASALDRSLAGG